LSVGQKSVSQKSFGTAVGADSQKSFGTLTGHGGKDEIDVADKAAWLLSSLIGHLSHRFEQGHVENFIVALSDSKCSKQGKLEAVVNVLKSPTLRAFAWSLPASSAIVGSVTANDDPKFMYKAVFAYWMLSFDNTVMGKLAGTRAIEKIRDFLTAESKSEKVVRLCLKVLQNFCNCQALEEDIAGSQVLPAVKSLEYEKWREEELYKDITSVSQAIQATVEKISNFDRYRKELDSGVLTWGPLHSSEFWAHSSTQKGLDKGIIEALVQLVERAPNTTTVQVACNDLGEIALQKTKIIKNWMQEAHAKTAVMDKMGAKNDKEVRREALLCCQKIMLNKWQDTQK